MVPKNAFRKCFEFHLEKQIRPAVDKVFYFDEARDALQYLFKGGHVGKVVVSLH